MRPVRVRLEGFSAYRAPVEVDFGGVDFFSITGPTGSGKSSLVDAMVFALYGRVPRLGGNAVAPAISAGADRARVSLEFELGGLTYTAVRMAQRTASGGGAVREARLEMDDQVLASGAEEVTRAVEGLLRLRFEDFTRTVVLPQGDFARFLTATKAERQGLLRELLGLDVYTKVRELAKTRAAMAGERVAVARTTLESLDPADPEMVDEAKHLLVTLEGLMSEVSAGEKELPLLDRRVEQAENVLQGIDRSLEELGAIEPPPGLGEVDALSGEARSRLIDAEETERETRRFEDELVAALEGLPSDDQLESWRRDRRRLAAIEARLADGAVEAARAAVEVAAEALQDASASADVAERGVVETRERHAAHALARSLTVGAPCPVCLRDVEELPRHGRLGELDAVDSAWQEARAVVDRCRQSLEEARSGLSAVEAARAELVSQAEDLGQRLAGAPTMETLDQLAEERAALVAKLEGRRADLANRVAATEQARRVLEELAERSRKIGRDLTTALLRVAALNPPTSESDDVAVQWKELLEWRDQTIDRIRDDRAMAEEALSEASTAASTARQRLARLLEDQGLEATEPFAVRVAEAEQKARSVVEAHEKTAEQAKALEEVITEAGRSAAVAETLTGHLRADGFERWMMVGALTELVTGANQLLAQLSGGGYSLAADESGGFSIVDHGNADEVRAVSTLSGGETFLVSLALALSLAETLASKGGAGLDAVVLDEGFGTLDEESLDTVASVLEELTGKLMVGVITHVKELAARAPVRYEVRREPRGAQVERLP